MPINSKKLQSLKKHFEGSLGQTILEVLIALILIILFLSGVIVVELYAIRNVNFARKKSIATTLARQQLERARVIRDSVGLDALSSCLTVDGCFINVDLTPAVTPTGTYAQTLYISVSVDCQIDPAITITPYPTQYMMRAKVNWARSITMTPAPEVEIKSCISDWR